MKKILFVMGMILASGSAFANQDSKNGEAADPILQINGYGEYIQCSDPRLFKYFRTANEAQRGCPHYENVYVTYDHGYRKYTCGCTANNENGGGNN